MMCDVMTKRQSLCWAVAGAVCLICASISIPILNVIVRQQVLKNMQLVEGTEIYSQWKSPTVPIYINVYVWDLQNPNDVKMGSKPVLVQKGPYTYREHRKKVDIKHNDNATVTYRQIVSYTFVREKSVGPDTETFTTVNIPLVACAAAIRWEASEIQKLSSLIFALAAEELFITRSVAEMVWGYRDPLLTLGMKVMPQWFYTDMVGAMAGRNGTDDGVYTVFTGEDDAQKLGIIDKYKGDSYLPFWSTPWANKINGTDGTLAPPFLQRDEVRYMFSSDVCRSAFAIYNRTVKSPQGIVLDQYVAPRKLMLAPPENPDNAGFCVPLGNCMVSGVLNITACMNVDHFPIPLMLSFPHFYLADPVYREAVIGMHPDAAQHNTYLAVEPTTGIVMELKKCLQVNVYILRETTIKQLANVKSVVYPLLWVNESAVIDDDNAHKFWLIFSLPVQVAHVVQYIMIVIGGVIVLCMGTQLLHIHITERKRQQLTADANINADETSPLLGSASSS